MVCRLNFTGQNKTDPIAFLGVLQRAEESCWPSTSYFIKCSEQLPFKYVKNCQNLRKSQSRRQPVANDRFERESINMCFVTTVRGMFWAMRAHSMLMKDHAVSILFQPHEPVNEWAMEKIYTGINGHIYVGTTGPMVKPRSWVLYFNKHSFSLSSCITYNIRYSDR